MYVVSGEWITSSYRDHSTILGYVKATIIRISVMIYVKQ